MIPERRCAASPAPVKKEPPPSGRTAGVPANLKRIECQAVRLVLVIRGRAHHLAQVVQLCAAHIALTHDLDALDLRGVHGEGALHADGEADLANGERLAIRSALATDDIALEHLDTLAVALGDAVVNLHVVADVELGDVLLDLLLFDGANDIHDPFLLIYSMKPNCMSSSKDTIG